MFLFDRQSTPLSAPLPPPRAPLPTLPCDLSAYALAETGPLSWSAISEERPRALDLDDPFDLE
jgi:hypothetical protein